MTHTVPAHRFQSGRPETTPTAMRTSLSISLIVSALSLAGCAGWSSKDEKPAPEAQKTGLVPQTARITDEKILGDRKTIEAVQQRLRVLNTSGIPQNN